MLLVTLPDSLEGLKSPWTKVALGRVPIDEGLDDTVVASWVVLQANRAVLGAGKGDGLHVEGSRLLAVEDSLTPGQVLGCRGGVVHKEGASLLHVTSALVVLQLQ